MSEKKDWYILFKSHTEAMDLYGRLKARGFMPRVSPTPRSASVCCGVSLLVQDEEIAGVTDYINENSCVYERIVPLKKQINPQRDKFC